MSMKNPLTPAGLEPATFRFVAQHLNHCATAVPLMEQVEMNNMYINIAVSNGSEKGTEKTLRLLLLFRHISVPHPPQSQSTLYNHQSTHLPLPVLFLHV